MELILQKLFVLNLKSYWQIGHHRICINMPEVSYTVKLWTNYGWCTLFEFNLEETRRFNNTEEAENELVLMAIKFLDGI